MLVRQTNRGALTAHTKYHARFFIFVAAQVSWSSKEGVCARAMSIGRCQTAQRRHRNIWYPDSGSYSRRHNAAQFGVHNRCCAEEISGLRANILRSNSAPQFCIELCVILEICTV